MSIAPQLFILAGVALGALASYLASSLTERTRYNRTSPADGKCGSSTHTPPTSAT